MTPEEKSLLERTHKIVSENNSILRKMRRANRWGLSFRILYWVVIIGAGLGMFYFLKPYIDPMMDVVDQAQSIVHGLNGSTSRASSTK